MSDDNKDPRPQQDPLQSDTPQESTQEHTANIPQPTPAPTSNEMAASAPEPKQPVAAPESEQSISAPEQPAEPQQPAPPTGPAIDVDQPVQPTPQPKQPAQPTPQPQQPAQPASQPQQADQPTPQPQQSDQPTPQPQQPVSQPAESADQPQQSDQSTPQPQQPAQPTPQPQQPAQPQQPGRQPQTPGPQPAAAPAGYQASVPQTPRSGKATAALVCGIASVVTALFVPVVGFILGIGLGIAALLLARKAMRATGTKSGKTTASKILAIAGFVISVISLVASIVLGVVIANVNQMSTTTSDHVAASASDSWDDLSSEEQAAAQPAVDQLNKIQNQDAALVTTLAADYDEMFKKSYGYSLTEMGVNPEDLARWAMSDFSYEFDSSGSVMVFDDDSASIYIDIHHRDYFTMMNTFSSSLSDYYNSDEYANATEKEDLAKYGELLYQAMDETTDTTSGYLSLDATKQSDGLWTLDEDSWNDEYDYIFSIF